MNLKHGRSKEPLYKVFCSMWGRCTNPELNAYVNYGGRGIKVCDRWRDYLLFAEDVGTQPGSGYSLERSNNDGDYEPSNVIWATRPQQSRNTRRNIVIDYEGRRLVLKDWAKLLGISYFTLIDRINVQGLSPREAFTRPVGRWTSNATNEETL